MGDGLAAAIGAEEVFEAGPRGEAAGIAKHGVKPQKSATIHRNVITGSSDSRNFRNVFAPFPQKSLFVRIG
jgi:hypothetical protein